MVILTPVTVMELLEYTRSEIIVCNVKILNDFLKVSVQKILINPR